MVVFDINEYYVELEKFMNLAFERKFITFECNELYSVSRDVDSVIECIESYEPTETPWQKLKNG